MIVLCNSASLANNRKVRYTETIGGRDYLFMEWKSGDYLYGGAEPGYYVFARV